MLKKLLMPLLGLFLFLAPVSVSAEELAVKFFWAEGCPHCKAEVAFLEEYLADKPQIRLEKYEVSTSSANQQEMVREAERLGTDVSGVPFTVIGDGYVIGFLPGITEQKLIDLITKSSDISETEGDVCAIDEPCESEDATDMVIKLPLLGETDLKSFSLPALSIVLGLVDGFNPCAMWTLLFLISLLLGMEDKRRMWTLGSAFIVASAAVYFVFMAAWLNLLLFIGLVAAVRIIIGLVALGAGGYNIKEFFTNKEATCKVTGNNKRQAVFARIRAIIYERSFWLALLGIVLLAFAVNLVELICSAGLPAVFTQVLAMSELAKWQYYSYIGLYILFFMIDDLVVFFIAMSTLQMTGISTKYSRISKLIGGLIMLIIGILMIFKPSWLMFG